VSQMVFFGGSILQRGQTSGEVDVNARSGGGARLIGRGEVNWWGRIPPSSTTRLSSDVLAMPPFQFRTTDPLFRRFYHGFKSDSNGIRLNRSVRFPGCDSRGFTLWSNPPLSYALLRDSK
jgi:hypothetical protein